MPQDFYEPIAALYDLSYGDYTDDIDFYENLANAVDGPVLELGVGTGRVALALAESGFDVTGIDVSDSMLARAREKASAQKRSKGSVELVQADMTNFELGKRFGMAFVAANTFQHLLTTAQQQTSIACVARHLAPDGIFAMSIRSPATVSWEEGDGWAPLLLHWTREDPATGDIVMKLCAEQPEPARMVRKLTYVYDRVHQGSVQRSVFVTELRYSTQAEITLLLQQCGLRVTHVYGDYDLSPVGIGENLVFVARSEGSR